MIDGKLLYPIGSIYMSIQDTNPSVFFGGTWERIAKGKTLVGVDENDADFNASSKTGGEKTHTLSSSELPQNITLSGLTTFSNIDSNWGVSNTNKAYMDRVLGTLGNGKTSVQIGNNQPHNNMQPYYTCYIFVRTA